MTSARQGKGKAVHSMKAHRESSLVHKFSNKLGINSRFLVAEGGVGGIVLFY
jgi:hypothetical protein